MIFAFQKNGEIMFSIFEYLRRRACDSFLAGVYDAIEILETQKVMPAPAAEPDKPLTLSPMTAPKSGLAQKILPLGQSAPNGKPVAEQKTGSAPEKKGSQTPAAPSMKSTPPPTTPIQPPPQTDLFVTDPKRDQPLPPRRRGRPRKNPPDGNSQ
jgi:hypothetical protein